MVSWLYHVRSCHIHLHWSRIPILDASSPPLVIHQSVRKQKTAGPRRQLAVCSAMKDVGVRQLQMQEIYTYSNPKKSQKDRKVTSCSNSGKSWFLSFWRLLYRIVIRYGDGSMDEHPPSWNGKRPIPLRSVFIGL